MTGARHRERARHEVTRDGVADGWEMVVELSVSNGDNAAALRQIMREHPELKELPESDVRIDVICGRSESSVRVLRRRS